MEVKHKMAVLFWPLFNKEPWFLPIKWLWHMRIGGQYLYTFTPLAFGTKRTSKHSDLASQGRLNGTCFPITRIGLFLWHSLRENTLDWLLVKTEKLSGGEFVGRVGEPPAPNQQNCAALGLTDLASVLLHRPARVCPVSSGWLKTSHAQQKHCQR